jgi:hypothetical protein
VYSFPPILTQKVSGRSSDQGMTGRSDRGLPYSNKRETKKIDSMYSQDFGAGIGCIQICMIHIVSPLRRVLMPSIYVCSRKKERCGHGKSTSSSHRMKHTTNVVTCVTSSAVVMHL